MSKIDSGLEKLLGNDKSVIRALGVLFIPVFGDKFIFNLSKESVNEYESATHKIYRNLGTLSFIALKYAGVYGLGIYNLIK